MLCTLASSDAVNRQTSLERGKKSCYAAAKDEKICYHFREAARIPAISQDAMGILDNW